MIWPKRPPGSTIRLAGEASVSANQITSGLMTPGGEGPPDLWPPTSICAAVDPTQGYDLLAFLITNRMRDGLQIERNIIVSVYSYFSSCCLEGSESWRRQHACQHTDNVCVRVSVWGDWAVSSRDLWPPWGYPLHQRQRWETLYRTTLLSNMDMICWFNATTTPVTNVIIL